MTGVEVGAYGAESGGIGSGLRVVPLKYVAASEMQRLLEPMGGRGVVVGADDTRNTLTLSGSGQDITSVLETISVFDVDVMKGMSFATVPVRSANPDAVADELRNVFGTSGSKGMIRFLPNNRLKSILIASPQREYLARAETWIRRLDNRAQGQERQLFTYKVQHRNAKDLVSIVNEMFGLASSQGEQQRSVAPRYQDATVQAAGLQTEAQLAGAADPTAAETGLATSDAQPEPSLADERVRIAADEANNSLLIMASPADYKRILAILDNLDASPRQVLLEATIMEVALNDQLKLGVRWYLQQKNASQAFTDLASKSFDSVFPGFSYAYQVANVQATLDALNQVTKVNIVSAPSLMVLDNHAARLQVGDQVPIITQSATGVQTAGSPVVNSVTYRDTGVILQITPHINDSGQVLLDIEQEVSSVTSTTSSSINSPTIKQRKVKTSVSVDDGHMLTLGGIIQSQRNRGADKVPLLGDIPLLGNAFKSRSDSIIKTELIILITPRVVRDAREAEEATEEYRRHLNLPAGRPQSSIRQPSASETIRRVVE